MGLSFSPDRLNIILPVGISFYTFQTLSYTLDVYRRSRRACDSLLDFALYVAFFPQLVAGPIVRSGDFLPQLASRPKVDGPMVEEHVSERGDRTRAWYARTGAVLARAGHPS